MDALHSDAEIAKSLETIASCVDWQCAAPDPVVESRSEAALLWASAANLRHTLLIDAKELASRPLGPVRVRECNMALLLGPGCRAEHERPDRLYVNLVHWTNAQRTKGKYVRLEDKGAAIFSTPFFVRPSQLVPFVRCASDGLNNRFEVRASLGSSFFSNVCRACAVGPNLIFPRADRETLSKTRA